MTTYNPPKKNTAYQVPVSLISQANTKTFQANPTLASGDVKVSIDGGAFNNLATLPTVTPAGGKAVQVSLSAAEMNGDNIYVLFSDAAGAEWCDIGFPLQTTARQFDDLAYPATSGRSLAVDASGQVDVRAIAAGAIAAATFAAGALDAVWSVASRLLTAGTNIVLAKGTGVTGFNDLDAAGVRTAVGLASANLDTQLGDLPTAAEINAEVVDALATDTYAEPGQGTPAATASLAAKIGFLHKAWRNKKLQTSSQFSLLNDDAVTVDQKATVSDDLTTTTVGEIVSGP